MLTSKKDSKKTRSIALRGKNQLTLPKEMVPSGVERFECSLENDGRIMLTPLLEIPASQHYFWTEEWQKGEREADEDARTGRVKRYNNVNDLFKEIESKRTKK